MRKRINIQILNVSNGRLNLAGNVPNAKPETEEFFAIDESGESIPLLLTRAPAMDKAATSERKASTGFIYDIELPLHVGSRYRFVCKSNGKTAKLSPKYGKFSRLTNLEHSFFTHEGLLLKAIGDEIRVYENKLTTRTASARRYEKTLQENAPEEALRIRKQAMRLKKKSKPIWILSDRTDAASDNGAALFEYLVNTDATAKYDLYFVISESCGDCERMQQVAGNRARVLAVGSFEHKAAWLAASLIISSAGDEWIVNPFGKERAYYQDLITSDFVFLQHGVIKDDLSGWLFRLKKNFRIFITSSPAEWDSICHGNYGYDESVVKLTGLARYDKLCDQKQKKIAFLPTWRKALAPALIPGTSERPYSETFRDSAYCRFYNRLINDPALLEALKEHGYTGTFFLHPSHANQWPDFEGNDTISVWKDLIPFSRVFNEYALLVTDYSSVAIDFAYLRKPVLYAQFDREEFYDSHTYDPGYYDYERDGFGPVCETYEDTLAEILRFIEGNCAEPLEYQARADQFFAFGDQKNCERIYEVLKEL